MKIQAIKVSITSIILLIVIFVCLLFIQPLYQKTSEIIQNQCINILTDVQNSTGLSISWKSISPSFLSIFQIKSVSVIDTSSKKTLLKVNKINCYIDVLSFFKKDYSKIVSKIVFDTISVSYNHNDNLESIEKLLSLFSSDSDSTKSVSIPFNIYFTNLRVSYIQDDLSSNLFFKSIEVKNNNEGLPILKTNGTVSVMFPNNKIIGNRIDLDINLQVLLFSDLSKCIAQLKLNKVDTRDFSLKPVELLIEYKDSNIQVQLLKNKVPFVLTANFDLEQEIFNLSLECLQLVLNSLLEVKTDEFILNNFLDSSISGKYNFNYLIEDKTFDYGIDSSIVLDGKVFDSSIMVNIILNGDNNFMTVQDLSCDSSFAKAFFTGEVNLQTLQPQGILTIDSLQISETNSIQTEVFIDPLKQGFMVFIPQLELGEQSFSAVQLNLIPQNNALDYSLEIGDYSHYEYSQEGKINCSGSLMYGEDFYLQSYISINSLFLDSILKTVNAFGLAIPDSTLTSTNKYVMSNDIYISTDFKSISYNVPFFIVANTQADRELAVMSFDGNESSIQLTQLDVMYNNQNVHADVQADFSSDFKELFFVLNLNVNAIPYQFNGSFMQGRQLIVEGDYDSKVFLLFENNQVNGNIQLQNFPINIDKYILTLSLSSELFFADENQWQVDINRLAIEEESDNLKVKPVLNCQGVVDNAGLIFENVTYIDNISTLIGNSSILWQINENKLDSLNVFLTLANPDSKENYNVQIDCNNPLQCAFSEENFIASLLFSAQVTLQNSPTSRFLNKQTQENLVNADILVLGSLENPAISANITNSMITLQGQNLHIQSQLILEDNHFQIRDADIVYGENELNDIKADIDIESFTGDVNALYRLPSSSNEINAKVGLSLFSQKSESSSLGSIDDSKQSLFFQDFIPSEFQVDFMVTSISSPLYGEIPDLVLHINKGINRIDFYTGDEHKVEGYILNDGAISLAVDKSLPLNFNANGFIKNGGFDININDFRTRLESFSKFINFDFFNVIAGYINGNIHLGGLITDPEFVGTFHVNDIDFTSRAFIKEVIHGDSFDIIANGKDFIIDNYTFDSSKGQILATIDLSLDRWAFDSIYLDLETLDETRVEVGLVFPIIKIDAQIACDIQLEVSTRRMNIEGDILADEANGIIYQLGTSNSDSEDNDYNYFVNLTAQVGKHGQVYYPSFETPLLRALVNPQTNVVIRFDSQQGVFDFLGDLVFKGGEISGYGRTFYLREGRLIFDDSQDFDPRITVRAEMRENDSNGEKVKIVLSAQNQRLSSFEPVFSAIPAKTDVEIMEILGQSISGSGSLASIGMNIGTGMLTDVAQSMIVKDIENGLRDMLKFDIFSIRSTALQNVGQIIVDNSKILSVGNFFDNSTVYVGKYIGNSLYFDAMFHLSYDENEVLLNGSTSGFSLNPEIGFELESPFATIRWSIAPDILDTKSLWIPDTSISLSWQVAF